MSLIGGTGGCMLGGSEDDLCRPTRSKEPDFQLLDAEDWAIPPRPGNWTEKEGRKRRVIKNEKKKKGRTSVHFQSLVMSTWAWLKVTVNGERECAECRGWGLWWGELGNTAGCYSSALLAELQTATNDIKGRLQWTSHKAFGPFKL